MERKAEIIYVTAIEDIPSLNTLRSYPRDLIILLVFENEVNNQRDRVGEKLKKELLNYQVSMHTVKPQIKIAKLISEEEIIENQLFFERCAKDYRKLGKELLFALVNKLKLDLNKDFPMETFNKLKRDSRQIGEIDGWRYFVHGFHCGFENHKTRQIIEVPLVFGLEFGDLDPYFFSQFIKSTPDYHPLPIKIYEDHEDGLRIIEKMVSLGKFERISSNIGNHYGVVVTDREKVEIKSHIQLDQMFKDKNQSSKFNFWKFLGLKK